jgi:hypothetical protein
MHIYQKIYEFAASAGSFEGYVYQKHTDEMDMEAITNWTDNLLGAYKQLPTDVREEFQASYDQTLGRAVRSLVFALGAEHEIIRKLKSMVKGSMPASADDFQKEKWFEESSK